MVQTPQLFLDRIGIFASVGCAIHCLAAAVLPALFAGLGLDALLGHEAEWGFTLFAIVVAGIATATGWRKHRSGKVLLFFGLGMALLLASRLIEEMGFHGVGTFIGILGGASLVTGHFQNIRTCSTC